MVELPKLPLGSTDVPHHYASPPRLTTQQPTIAASIRGAPASSNGRRNNYWQNISGSSHRWEKNDNSNIS